MTTGGGFGGGEVDTAYVDVTVRHNGEQSMREMEREVEQGADRAGRSGGGALSRAFGGMLGGLPGLAAGAAAAVGAALAGGAVQAVNAFADFEATLSGAQAVLGATGAEMGRLKDLALEMGANTSFSASESAKAIEELGSAGLSTAAIMDGGLKGALDLAAATGMKDVGEAATIAAGSLNAFGLAGKDMAAVADLVANGANVSALNVRDFGSAVQAGGAVAKASGLDITEFTGAVSLMADQMITGSDAGTSMKSFLAGLTPSSEEAAKAMKALGVSAFDQKGNMLPLRDIVGNLQKAFSGLTEEQRAMNAETIFGSDGVRAFNVLMDAGTAGLDKRTSALGRVGTAQEAAATRLDNLKGDMEKFRGNIDSALIAVGEAISKNLNLRGAVQGLTQGVEQITPLVAGLVPKIVGAFTEVGNRVTGIVQPLVPMFRSVFSTFAPYVQQMAAQIVPVVQSLGPLFKSTFTLVAQVWQTVLQPALRDILPVVSAVFSGVAAAVRGAIGIVTGVINAVVALLRGDLPGAVKALEGAFEAGVNGAVGAMRGLLTGVLRVVSAVAPQFAGAARDIIAGLIRGIEGGAGLVVQAARNLAQGVISGIKNTLIIRSPSKVTTSFGEFVGIGLVNGMAKTTPEVQATAARLAGTVVDEVAKARAALEKDIAFDKWVVALRAATPAQLASAQATARAAGEADRYNAITAELARRQDVARTATDRATDAARRSREELANNRAQINRTEQTEAFTKALRSYTDAQLSSNLATAKAGGEVERYNAIRAEQERRDDAATASTERAAQAARQHAEQLAASRKAITDGLKFEAYVSGLTGYTDAQLAAARSNALVAGEGQRFNAVLAEQRTRAEEAARAVAGLAEAQIAAANSRATDTLGMTDSAYRQTYGAGDEGLIRSLAATTGLSVAKIREDVFAALDDAKKFAPGVATIIERVWDDALKHRREVAARQREIDDATFRASAGNAERIAENFRTEQAAADDAAITFDSLNAILAELNAQGRDPTQSGFTSWLEELAQGSGRAAVAAQQLLDVLERQRLVREQMVQAPLETPSAARSAPSVPNPFTPDTQSGPVEARGRRAPPPTVTPSDARVPTGLTKAWDELQSKLGSSVWLKDTETRLRGLTDAQLASAKAAALASKNVAEYSAVVTEEERRTKAAADAHKAWADNLDKLEFDRYVAGLKHLSDGQLQAALDAARASEDVARFNAILAEVKDREVNVTFKVGGLDLGIRKLDLFKTAVDGLSSGLQGVFADIASGSAQSAGDVVKSMARMALGIVRSVAVSIAAMQAQIVVQQLLALGTAAFNPLALAKAAALLAISAIVAGVASGLESRLSHQASSIDAGAGSTSGTTRTTDSTPSAPSSVNIPTSQVTVMATPEFVVVFGAHVDRFGGYVNRLVERGVSVRAAVEISQPRGNGLAWELGTGGL